MTISLSQIQKVMQIYGKQVRNGARLRQRSGSEQKQVDNSADVSTETKRTEVIDRVTSEIITKLVNGNLRPSDIESKIMTRLSQEFGENLSLIQDSSTGRFVFHAVDYERGEIIQELNEEESGELLQRLIEMTREIVDKTML
ncbi:MAG: hypothetical protein JRG97_14290 [Deltaproteobacteria bacterium]|nr:hypothetical protein [Deltaproteobacteria bacterium]MBW2050806.1 hypothetical protein [Deltaproteobacteria bacterium]MBW2142211.1 hypothetical protein [Deltaproteobacteria bacterium]MBW2322673.1 hypothetical protein [Deltaproteobacteria bacterium]